MKVAVTAVLNTIITELQIHTSVISAHAASLLDYSQRLEKSLKQLKHHLKHQENLSYVSDEWLGRKLELPSEIAEKEDME